MGERKIEGEGIQVHCKNVFKSKDSAELLKIKTRFLMDQPTKCNTPAVNCSVTHKDAWKYFWVILGLTGVDGSCHLKWIPNIFAQFQTKLQLPPEISKKVNEGVGAKSSIH